MDIKHKKPSLKESIIKRLFDIFFSLLGLIITFPIILVAWFISTIENKTNGLFIQSRIGRSGKLFNIYKIRTMKNIPNMNNFVTSKDDIRICKSGLFFRKTKIDELPQLLNVFLGQMSFVGPRPDMTGYADRLEGNERIILTVRPGITGPAQLFYKNEEEILAKQDDIVKYNDEVIWPNKVKINISYVENYTILKDFYYIWKTIVGGNVKY